VGRHKGLTEEQVEALDEFETSTTLDELQKLVIRYAVGMTETPVDVPDELFDALEARLTSKQLVELTSAIAWENYRARFDHACGMESEGFMTSGVLSSL